MKFFVYFLVIISVSFSLSCAKSNTVSSQEEVVIDDGYKTTSKGEIVFDDLLFAGNGETVSDTRPILPQKTITIADRLHITTMYDGLGNKTETRFFDDDSLLRTVIIRTSVTGEKQMSVFALNGTVRDLPVNMQDKVMTAPARDIAAAAGIYEERQETPLPTVVQNNPLPDINLAQQKPPTEVALVKTIQTENPESAPTKVANPTSENPVSPDKEQSDEQN